MSEDLLVKPWRVWEGDKNCPHIGMVEIKFRDGDTYCGQSTSFRWDHVGFLGERSHLLFK